MKRFKFGRPSASLIIGSAALAVAFGGVATAGVSAHSARHISGTLIKKHSEPGNRLKNNTVTGKQVKESTLGKVKHAAQADNSARLGGLAAGAYQRAGATQPFAALLNEDQTKVVATNSSFDVVAVCDANGSLPAPLNEDTAIYIVNKGADNGEANTSDDSDTDFDIGDAVGFDFLDRGDSGDAVLPDGHSVHVTGGIVTDTSTPTPVGLSKDCSFNGVAFFN